MQSHRGEHGAYHFAAGRLAIRRNRAAYAGRPRFRRARAAGGLSAGGPRARRSVRRLRFRTALEKSRQAARRQSRRHKDRQTAGVTPAPNIKTKMRAELALSDAEGPRLFA